MAAITATFAAAAQPRIVSDPATIKVTTKYVLTGTLSAGDVIHFTNVKIPTGATIIEADVSGIHPNGGTVANLGLAGGLTAAAALGSLTLSATFVFHRQAEKSHALPYKVSVSDDAALRYVYPTLTTTAIATATGSLSLGLTIEYTLTKTNW